MAAKYLDNAVKAGVTYTIPDPAAGFEFSVSGPSGHELIRAIASHEPGSHHRLHAGDAERILDDLNQLAANIVEWSTTNCAPDGDATYRSMERSLATIVTQLDSLDRSGRVANRNVGAAGVGLEKLDDVAAVLNAYV